MLAYLFGLLCCVISNTILSDQTTATAAEAAAVTPQQYANSTAKTENKKQREQWDVFGRDIGVAQMFSYGDVVLDTFLIRERIYQAQWYMNEKVWKDFTYMKVHERCRNKRPECSIWALLGECEANPIFMQQKECAPACFSCHMVHADLRCFYDPKTESKEQDAIKYSGDLNRFFERILTAPEYQPYEPTALSRPTSDDDDGTSGVWVIQLDKFITSDEANRLIELGASAGYQQSWDFGEELEDGSYGKIFSNLRTSTNAWCNKVECRTDPMARTVLDRMQNLTGIPEHYYEPLQLLRYEPGQLYVRHHDYFPIQYYRPCGVRILTLYIYLSDVEEGGETYFPVLNVTVKPKQGRAIIWPNVIDADPNIKDDRTDHQALPVIKGVKYGANAWIHQRDYLSAGRANCTG